MKVAVDGRVGMVFRELFSASKLSANYANETLLSVSSFWPKAYYRLWLRAGQWTKTYIDFVLNTFYSRITKFENDPTPRIKTLKAEKLASTIPVQRCVVTG